MLPWKARMFIGSFFNVLKDDFEILLVNARHAKNVLGHKTDKKDSQWIIKLLLSGLLEGSFIPPRDIRELCDLRRYRKKIVAQIASEKNRIIKILESGNIKFSSVLSNVDGATGTKIIDRMIEGKADIDALMQFYHGKIKVSREEFCQFLEGHLTEHHRVMLRLHKESIADTERQLASLDVEIKRATEAYQVEIELLQTIPGVGKSSAITIISEIGVDMDRFPDEHHLSSWSGMSPGNNESGGKKKR